jgi:hypothetical protein
MKKQKPELKIDPIVREKPKHGRNVPCWCGAKKENGEPKKYKNCHYEEDKKNESHGVYVVNHPKNIHSSFTSKDKKQGMWMTQRQWDNIKVKNGNGN